MKTLGLDIGTTSISCVVMDVGNNIQLFASATPNESYVSGMQPWERQQDPQVIEERCRKVLKECLETWPDIDAIGITGQMHGIVYLDEEGRLLSNLFTWQDARGNQQIPNSQETYAQRLSRITDSQMSTGYGLTTHYFNLQNGIVPQGARKICTIMDYIAMRLCGRNSPSTHPTNAASLGLYDLERGTFSCEKLAAAGIDGDVLPSIVKDECFIGTTPGGIPVSVPLGDNQAGIFSLYERPGDVIINIGTSSQVSTVCINKRTSTELEIRPFVGGKYVILGTCLCGGSSLSLLNDFFAKSCASLGLHVSREQIYDMMLRTGSEALDSGEPLVVKTQFDGTRQDPKLHGGVENITVHNFLPGNLSLGFCQGICDEMYESFRKMDVVCKRLFLCGNAARKNTLLRRVCEETFGTKAILPPFLEEAATGAAFYAARIQARGL